LSHGRHDHMSTLACRNAAGADAALARRSANGADTALARRSANGAEAALTFIAEWLARLAPRRGERLCALDVAMGRGRHAVALALGGFDTFGIDIRFDAVRDATMGAEAAGVHVRAWCADLTQHPLPSAHFDVIVVTRYLQRDLFPALRAAVRPGGVMLYETFTTAQRGLGRGPTSPDHLLEPGELRQAFEGFEVLFYEEVLEPDALARLAARRVT
jgi:tellurite methyltransferase